MTEDWNTNMQEDLDALFPTSAERPEQTHTPLPEVRCIDCGRPYPHGLDVVLTKKQWLMIHPDDGGVLCPSCIVNRAEKLPGSVSVYAHIVFGKDYDAGDSIEKLVTAIRLENADYCAANGDLKHELLTACNNYDVLKQSHAALVKEAKLWHDAHAELSILFASGEKERDSLRDVLCAYREQHRVLQGCFVAFIDSYLPSAVTHADYRCPNCKNTDELLEELDAALANAKKLTEGL